jgi:hypothetical protein
MFREKWKILEIHGPSSSSPRVFIGIGVVVVIVIVVVVVFIAVVVAEKQNICYHPVRVSVFLILILKSAQM